MVRVVIVVIITAAVAVAIAITFREDVGLRWFGPDFIVPGADLPEAELGEEPPAAPIVYVSREWIMVRGKRVASAGEAVSDPDIVIDGLDEALVSLAKEFRISRGYIDPIINGEGTYPSYRPEDDLIIQADREVEFELLIEVIYTCGKIGFMRLNLAAINPDNRELEVFSLELPYAGGTGHPINEPDFEIEPSINELNFEIGPFLDVGGSYFKLRYWKATGEYVVGTIEVDYSLLSEELMQMKRLRPGQKSLIILCGAHVKYEDLIHVIEVLVQPGIALTEISLSGNPVSD